MQLLRLLRLLRLFRLARMIRLARIFRRWEAHIGISYSHLKLIRFSVAKLVCAHCLACGFHLMVVLEDSGVRYYCLSLLVHMSFMAYSNKASACRKYVQILKTTCCHPR